MKISFIGYGNVGSPLADHLQRLGHTVILATDNPNSDSAQKALERNAQLQTLPAKDAVQQADVVFLATPFQANQTALEPVMAELAEKILVDCTNPVGAGLTHGLNNEQSGSELIQSWLPNTKIVKAFSIYGFENLENNQFDVDCVKPVMLFCGEDTQAKQTVGTLITELGWEPLDVGGLVQALHLEHMTLLWIRMVRMNGQPSRTVWARLGGK